MHVPPLLLFAVMLAPMGELQAQNKHGRRLGAAIYSEGGPCDTTAWKLVFHDEFDGVALDRSKWVTYFTYSADGSDQCEGCRVTGSSNTIYRDEQVRVADGLLTLGVEARTGTWFGITKEHESGMVHSIGQARFNHGRFEVRCRIPAAPGLWPAFWGFGGETEIDVFEFCGERPQWMKASLHQWGTSKYSHTGKHKATDLSRDFHTYAVEWEEDEVRWYLDGELVHARSRPVDKRGRPLPACDRPAGVHNTAPYFPRQEDALNVILNLSVSPPNDYCNGPRKPGPWPAGTALVVDHVRVYQRWPQSGLADLCTEARVIVASRTGPLRSGEECRYTVSGPHGALQWETSSGLQVVSTDAEGLSVQVAAGALDPQWVRATSMDDPCLRGGLMLETPVALSP